MFLGGHANEFLDLIRGLPSSVTGLPSYHRKYPDIYNMSVTALVQEYFKIKTKESGLSKGERNTVLALVDRIVSNPGYSHLRVELEKALKEIKNDK